jgi:hypothetical protein
MVMAYIYMLVEEHDLAMDTVEPLLAIPGAICINLLRVDPIWAPLRGNERFEAMLAKGDVVF